MPKLRVLLIEDHLAERINLMKVLADMGLEAESAVNFHRARDLVKIRNYDLIVSELLLNHCPELQGDGVQFWSFAQSVSPNIEVLLLADSSTKQNTEDLMQGMAAPPILSKPVSAIELKEALEAFILTTKKIPA